MSILKNKVAIVTGGAQGIGKAISQKFAMEGSSVVIADINFEKAAATASELSEKYNECIAYKVDVTDEANIAVVVNKVVEKYGKIDILVNNAGIQPPKQEFFEISSVTWDKTMEVNVKSIFLFSKAVAKVFIKQGFGNIVNTASVVGPFVWEGSLHYIASKGAVNAITKAMALELSKYNIRVNAVAPGHVDTEINKETLSKPGAREKISGTVPLRRIALPEDLAGAFAFLASDNAAYITGHILYVDGGLSQVK